MVGAGVMDVFANLSYEEQVFRLTRAAQSALISYSLPLATVKLVLYVHNAMFKVITPTGEQYALRLQLSQRSKPINQTRSELRWLSAIHRDTTLRVPEPVLSDQGYITFQPVEGVQEPVSVVLFRWLEGASPGHTLTVNQAAQAGQFMGQLHAHSRQYAVPGDFDRPYFDWEGLFGESSIYFPGENRAIFTSEQALIFDWVAESMATTLTALAERPGSFGLIHADFILKNILFTSTEVAAIDFDDSGFGFYLYDLAPLLLQLLDQPNYVDLRAAWLDGYRAVQPLSSEDEGLIETMIAARLLRSCYWIACNLHNPNIRSQAPAMLEYRAATLRDYLNTGRVSRRGDQF